MPKIFASQNVSISPRSINIATIGGPSKTPAMKDQGPRGSSLFLTETAQAIKVSEMAGQGKLKKKLQTCIDIVESYLESGLDVLGQEKKYNFINKFGPKKCPEEQGRAAHEKDAARFLFKQTPTKMRSLRKRQDEISSHPGSETSFMAEFGSDPFDDGSSAASQIQVPQEFLRLHFLGWWRSNEQGAAPQRQFRETLIPNDPVYGRRF